MSADCVKDGGKRQKFWSAVAVGNTSACWEWTGKRDSKGYGRSGRYGRAHRLAYEFSRGPIPSGLWVLHRCDNPPCCNPAHLFLGTAADNVRDMVLKKRQAIQPGEINGWAKLTDVDVRAIRALYATGLHTQRGIGARFGVHQVHVSRIVRGRVRVTA